MHVLPRNMVSVEKMPMKTVLTRKNALGFDMSNLENGNFVSFGKKISNDYINF